MSSDNLIKGILSFYYIIRILTSKLKKKTCTPLVEFIRRSICMLNVNIYSWLSKTTNAKKLIRDGRWKELWVERNLSRKSGFVTFHLKAFQCNCKKNANLKKTRCNPFVYWLLPVHSLKLKIKIIDVCILFRRFLNVYSVFVLFEFLYFWTSLTCHLYRHESA